jgi:predicted ester cyclase
MAGNAPFLMGAIARWNAGDLDGYLELYATTIRLHGYSPEPMDLAGVRGFYRMIWDTLHMEGKSNPAIVVEDVFEAGGMLACRVTMSGHHVGPFMGYGATGRPYRIPVITTLRFADTRCVERWSCADMLGLLAQIGAFTPAA